MLAYLCLQQKSIQAEAAGLRYLHSALPSTSIVCLTRARKRQGIPKPTFWNTLSVYEKKVCEPVTSGSRRLFYKEVSSNKVKHRILQKNTGSTFLCY